MDYFFFGSDNSFFELLDNPSSTLEDILDHPSLQTYSKEENQNLVSKLSNHETLEKALHYLLFPTSEESHRKYRYSIIVSDLICNCKSILEEISSNQTMIMTLFSIYGRDPVDIIIATNVTRVLVAMINLNYVEISDLFQSNKGLFGMLLHRLDLGCLVSLWLALLKPQPSQLNSSKKFLEWVGKIGVIEAFVQRLDPRYGETMNEQSCAVLLNIIEIQNETTPQINFSSSNLNDEKNRSVDIDLTNESSDMDIENSHVISPLFSFIEHEVSTKLLLRILEDAHSTLSEHTTAVVVKLLKSYNHKELQILNDISELPQILRTLTQNVDDFVLFLKDAPQISKKVVLPIGEIEAFGFHRSRIVELIEALVRTNYSCILEALLRENVIQTCISYFFHYKWNNFLHTMVASMLEVIFQSCPEPVILLLLEQSNLIQLICQTMSENQPVRSANAGHIVKITSFITKSTLNHPQLNQILCQNVTWTNYLQNIYFPLQQHWQSVL